MLAKKYNADKVIIDERMGRSIAEYLSLCVVGSLGGLAKGKQLGIIPSFQMAALDMQSQGIYYNKALIQRMANQLGETP